jgi:hypothetical protein
MKYELAADQILKRFSREIVKEDAYIADLVEQLIGDQPAWVFAAGDVRVGSTKPCAAAVRPQFQNLQDFARGLSQD